VITTTGTPWKSLPDIRCGWYAENNSSGIEKALDEALACKAEDLNEMGKRGRTWVQTHFSWLKSAEKMADTYRWIVEKGQRPDCVFLD
jgi:glycosyltransferase involved in cell wall biosynthesis